MSTIQVKREPLASAPKTEGPSGLSVCGWVRERLTSFAHDAAGDVAILFGLMAMVMFFLMGAAVDVGRWLNARDQTLAATDAAVLAAGRALQTNPGKESEAIAIAQKYYSEITKTRLTVKSDTINFQVVDGGTQVTAINNATIATPFLGLAGIYDLPLFKDTGAEYSKAIVAVGKNAEVNLEVAMMLDTSGSMGQSTNGGNAKYIDMRAAASDLVDIVVWADQSAYKSRVAVIPFSGDVRVPTSILANVTDPIALPSVDLTTNSHGNTNHHIYWNSLHCVAERGGVTPYTDAAPGPGHYIPFEYSIDNNGDQVGECSQSQNGDELMAMSNDRTALKAKINGLSPRGATAGQIGTAWAWYLLSPNFASVLPTASRAVPYGTAKTKKIAILMTDGEYNSEHDVNGVKTGSSGAGSSINPIDSPHQARATCTAMKAAGIEVYTIGFDVGGNQTAVDTLSNCASAPTAESPQHYYNATDGDAIKAAFRDIALKLTKLRLTN